MIDVSKIADTGSYVDQLQSTLESNQRTVWVAGPVGSGRRTLLKKLCAVDARFVPVSLPDIDEPDVAAHGLAQAAAGLKDVQLRAGLLVDWSNIADGATSVADQLSEQDSRLAVRVPDSWQLDAPQLRSRDRVRIKRAADLLDAWVHHRTLRVVLITSKLFNPGVLGLANAQIVLSAAEANFDCLEDNTRWGAYSDAAHELKVALNRRATLHPLTLRVAVGLCALGMPGRKVARCIQDRGTSAALAKLGKSLVQFLGEPDHQRLRESVKKLTFSRQPVPREVVLEATGVPQEHGPMVTECLAYGDESVMTGLLRSMLSRAFKDSRDSTDDAAHETLANHYCRLDGEANPSGVTNVLAWLEKVHHLGHAGDAGFRVWHQQNLPSREFYWDHARHLSIDRREFKAAAKVYRSCLERFSNDDYAWHYLAYNLERGGEDREGSEHAYRRAMSLDRANPRWNRRLVTFLIGQGRPRAARKEWTEALARVDEDGDRVQRDSWLAEEFHLPIARAWLASGRVVEATEVIETIPTHVVETSDQLGDLVQQVADAAEADYLGVSVYPPGVPIDERWRGPQVLPHKNANGADLKEWFPGSVVEASAKNVRIAYAVPSDDEEGRRVLVTTFDVEQWRGYQLGQPKQANGFVELGTYDDGSTIVCRVPAVQRSRSGEPRLSLAFLSRWRSR